MSEEILCVSYFDEVIGPSVFYCNIPSLDGLDYPDFARVFDLNEEEGSFIFAFRKFQTLNHFFSIDSEYARGGKNLLMISYMIKIAYFKNEILDVFKYLDSKKKVLINFSLELSKMEELPRILREVKNEKNMLNVLDTDDKNFEEKFLKIFNEYYGVISYKPLEKAMLKPNYDSKKIFILGTPHSGKTTFLKDVEDMQFYLQKNQGLPTRIYEIVIDNMQILSYDCFVQKLECDQCKNLQGCIENAQGFVVVFNLTNEESILLAKENFISIVNSCGLIESENIPVLLIGNKFNGSEVFDDSYISELFDFKDLETCGMKMKYFALNLEKESDKVLKALRWMVKHML